MKLDASREFEILQKVINSILIHADLAGDVECLQALVKLLKDEAAAIIQTHPAIVKENDE